LTCQLSNLVNTALDIPQRKGMNRVRQLPERIMGELIIVRMILCELKKCHDILSRNWKTIRRISRILRIEGVRDSRIDWTQRRITSHNNLVRTKREERPSTMCIERYQYPHLLAVLPQEAHDRPCGGGLPTMGVQHQVQLIMSTQRVKMPWEQHQLTNPPPSTRCPPAVLIAASA